MKGDIPSIVEMWETFAARLPADVSSTTALYMNLRDTWYAATYNTLITFQELSHSATNGQELAAALKALFDESESLVSNMRSTRIS